jgi:hypothetical protein
VANHHKRAKPPDLHSVDLKMWRAECHQKALHVEFAAIGKVGLNSFEPKVEEGALKHSYYPIHPNPVPDSLLAKLGDCVHNLNSALDHLACNLVRVSGFNAIDDVYFPVHPTELRVNPCTGDQEKRLQIKVRPEIREWLDSIQPYKGTETGMRLWTLHNLDVTDKHRGHLVAAFAALGIRKTYTASNWETARKFPVGQVTWTSPEPLAHGKKCLTVTYDAPQLEVDADLKIATKILFGRGSGVEGQGVLAVVDDLMRLVALDLLPAAMPFFGLDPEKAEWLTEEFTPTGLRVTHGIGLRRPTSASRDVPDWASITARRRREGRHDDAP